MSIFLVKFFSEVGLPDLCFSIGPAKKTNYTYGKYIYIYIYKETLVNQIQKVKKKIHRKRELVLESASATLFQFMIERMISNRMNLLPEKTIDLPIFYLAIYHGLVITICCVLVSERL